AAARIGGFPALETTSEAGVPYMAVDAWFGLFAPRGTPGQIVQRLGDAFLGALAEAESARRVEAAGFNLAGLAPGAFAEFQRAEVLRWQEMAQLTGITMDP
ncbi:MAG: tripartite tricarboxylate transporter substrate binding protein, partial [Rhodospirillaceae bacterium]|nr:tripartite tricarboxylate transporter substrate binding protein [Rhodospirillales bacterium]